MLNDICLMGRLTADPELRHTQSGIAVASFTLSVDRDYSGKDGGEKQTDFIPCVAWRTQAEIASRYCSKGQLLSVKGRLQSRKWQDKEGHNRTAWEVICDSIFFCGKSQSQSDHDAAPDNAVSHPLPAGKPVDVDYTAVDDDDLPF